VRPEIIQPYLLLCEGKQDKKFFEALFSAHSIGGFLVECPEEKEEGAGGVDQYPSYFTGLIARTRPSLKGFIVTTDCDTDATTAFVKVADWLDQKGYTRPTAPLAITPQPFNFAVMILTIPPGMVDGCLETLLYPAATTKWASLVSCVDAFWNCIGVGVGLRSTNHESKVKLRVLLAAAYPKNPNLTLARIWDDPATTLPLTTANFNPLLSEIRKFCANV
jgi:hypothetical protein